MEAGNELADQTAGLTADVALAVDQQLVEEGERLGLLPHRQIGEVFFKDVEVGPQLLPALGGPGGLDDVAELLLVGQHVHQPDVVLHRQQDQAVQRLLRVHQSGVLGRRRGLGVAGQIHIHAQTAHVVLEVVELSVDEFIPAALCPVHIVQLGQDDLEGLLQRVEDRDLVALRVPGLLGTEVGVNEQQGFHRQGLQLQVPGGVVGGDMADIFHLPGQQPLVGVVIVEVGYPLPGPAAEFAEVVGRGCAGDERQVHLHPGLLQAPGGGHGDVVNAGDVAQDAEGGKFQTQPHEFIDIFLPPGGHEAAVLLAVVAGGVLLRRQELEVQHGVEGKGGPLVVQQYLKNGEVKFRGLAPAVRLNSSVVGEHEAADVLVAEGAPALLRSVGAQPGHQRGAQFQHPGAGQPLPDGEQGGQPRLPVGVLQQGQRGLSVGEGDQPPGSQGLGDLAVNLTDQLVVHREATFPVPVGQGG